LSKELLEKVEQIYESVKTANPNENVFVKKLYESDWLAASEETIKTQLHTSYHPVEKLTNGLAIKW
jgi:hypothetical protein